MGELRERHTQGGGVKIRLSSRGKREHEVPPLEKYGFVWAFLAVAFMAALLIALLYYGGKSVGKPPTAAAPKTEAALGPIDEPHVAKGKLLSALRAKGVTEDKLLAMEAKVDELLEDDYNHNRLKRKHLHTATAQSLGWRGHGKVNSDPALTTALDHLFPYDKELDKAWHGFREQRAKPAAEAQ